jgi:hypothetical protein
MEGTGNNTPGWVPGANKGEKNTGAVGASGGKLASSWVRKSSTPDRAKIRTKWLDTTFAQQDGKEPNERPHS